MTPKELWMKNRPWIHETDLSTFEVEHGMEKLMYLPEAGLVVLPTVREVDRKPEVYQCTSPSAFRRWLCSFGKFAGEDLVFLDPYIVLELSEG